MLKITKTSFKKSQNKVLTFDNKSTYFVQLEVCQNIMFDLRDSTGIAANDGMFGPDGGVGLDLSGWPLRLNIAVDVAKGMSYLHGEGIFHRDLTSKNVLVRVSTDSTGGCKVQSSLTQSQCFSYLYLCSTQSLHLTIHNLQKA